MQHFIEHPKDGDMAVSSGIVVPIYQIPEGDYSVVAVDEKEPDGIPESWKLFCYDFPLEVDKRVVVTDIYTILNWDISDWPENAVCPQAGPANGFEQESGCPLAATVVFGRKQDGAYTIPL